MFRQSRATLTEYGNIAAATVLDALGLFAEEPPALGARGVIAGSGPGITAEMAVGTWQPDPAPIPSSALHPPSSHSNRNEDPLIATTTCLIATTTCGVPCWDWGGRAN